MNSTRRTYLQTVGSALVPLGLNSMAKSNNIKQIDINIYATDEHVELQKKRDLDPWAESEIAAQATRSVFSQLPDEYNLNVSVIRTPIPNDSDKGPHWILNEWDGAVADRDDTATDSNLLLTTSGGFSATGLAEGGHSRAGSDACIIESAPSLREYVDKGIPLWGSRVSMVVLQAAVHEIGHNLGLEHDHGLIYRGEDAVFRSNELISTCMIGSHGRRGEELGGTTNHWGTKMPTYNSGDADIRQITLTPNILDNAEDILTIY